MKSIGRIAAMLLSLCMALTLLPATAFAANAAPTDSAAISTDGGNNWTAITGYTSASAYTGTLVAALNDTGIVGTNKDADVIINIPAGVTLMAGVMADQSANINACVGIPSTLKSLTFTGGGLLKMNGAAQAMIFFNGVPTVIDGISIGGDTANAMVIAGTSHTTTVANILDASSAETANKYCAGALTSTSLTLKSGTVGSIAGGSMNTDVGTVNLRVEGGTVLTNVTGGNILSGTICNFKSVEDNGAGGKIDTVNITVTGGTFSSIKDNGYIFGGSGCPTPVTTTNITMTGGECNYIFGGGQGGTVTNSNVTFGGNAINNKNIFGGNDVNNSIMTSATVNITGGFVGDSVYGGGMGDPKNSSTITNTTTTTVNVTGGYITRSIHGGAYQGAVGTANVTVNGATFLRTRDPNGDIYDCSFVYGGGKKDTSTTGSATVNVIKAYNCLGVSGGGLSTADRANDDLTTGTKTVTISDLHIIDNSGITPGSGTLAAPMEAFAAALGMSCNNIYVDTDVALAANLPSSTKALISIASGKTLSLGSYGITGGALTTGGGSITKTVGSYTATINLNGATGDLSEISVSGNAITLGSVTKSGFIFDGWSDGTTTYPANTAITLSGDKTLTPATTLTAGVTGRVTDGTNIISGAKVTLQQGSNTMATATTNANGEYYFTNVAYGAYNIVTEKDDITKTSLLEVSATAVTVSDIVLVSSTKQSVVEVASGAPAAVVAGVDTIAEMQSETNVIIKIALEQQPADSANAQQTAIDTIASNDVLTYIDIELTKQVGADTPTDIGSTNNTVLELIVPFDFINKTDVTVYRYHGTTATAFTKLGARPSADSRADGTYYLDKANGRIFIYASKYSTYAVGYDVVSRDGSDHTQSVNPAITDPTTNTTVTATEGNAATMSIAASGAVSYQWQINRNDGMGWISLGEYSNSLTTGAVETKHNGYQYRCIVNGNLISPIFTLRVAERPDIPQTGDNALPGLWLGIMLLAGAGLAGSIVLGRRKRHSN